MVKKEKKVIMGKLLMVPLVDKHNSLTIVPFEESESSANGGKSLRRGRFAKHVGQRKIQEKHEVGDKKPYTPTSSKSSQ